MANTQDADVLNAFCTQLATITGGYRIAWENIVFSPETTETWLEPTMLPARTVPAELGINGMNMRKGIFQVTVHSPKGQSPGIGAGPGLSVVGLVVDLFRRGDALSSGSVSDINIVSSSRGPRMADPDWYSIPISIEWWAFTSNDGS